MVEQLLKGILRRLQPGGQVASVKMLPPLGSHKRKHLPFLVAKPKEPLLLPSHSLPSLGYLLLPGVEQWGQHQLLLHSIPLKSRLDNVCWSLGSSSLRGTAVSQRGHRQCRWVSADSKQLAISPACRGAPGQGVISGCCVWSVPELLRSFVGRW